VTIDAATLKAMIAEDTLGLLELPIKARAITTDERLAASFDEITEFVRAHGREPAPGSSDVAEIKLHARLQALRDNDQAREALVDRDDFSLLVEPEAPGSVAQAAADDPLGLLDPGDEDVFTLRHVPKAPAAQPDRVAQRKPCQDFDLFEPLFKRCHAELRAGARKVIAFRNEQEIREKAFYVHRGLLTYVAEEGERRIEHGRPNARLRCIFENGTEADLLLRSFASQLYRFGRQVTDPVEATKVTVEMQLDGRTGYVYLLRSLSKDPGVQAIPDLYKIGFTTSEVAQRTSGASRHATFLGATVEEVAVYEMPAAMARGVETLLHRFFALARIDAWFEQEGVSTAEVREWFSVPLNVIDEAIDLLQAESIESYEYDPGSRAIQLRGARDGVELTDIDLLEGADRALIEDDPV
jgi:hypothetical protein